MRQTVQRHLLPLTAIIAVLLTACMADEVGGVYMITKETDTLHAVADQKAELTFNAGGEWTASTADSWLEITPQNGDGGRNTITVRTTEQNRTKQLRKTLVMVSSDGKSQAVPVIQRSDFAFFDTLSYQVGPEGDEVILSFTTNVPKGELYISYVKYGWFSIESNEEKTRAGEWSGKVKPITVMPNESTEERSAKFVLGFYDERKNFMVLDSTWIHQKGAVP